MPLMEWIPVENIVLRLLSLASWGPGGWNVVKLNKIAKVSTVRNLKVRPDICLHSHERQLHTVVPELMWGFYQYICTYI